MASISEVTELSVTLPESDLDHQSPTTTPQASVASETNKTSACRPFRSWIWQHAALSPSGHQRLYNPAGAAVWRCSYCVRKVEYVLTGGTRTIKDHLLKVHRLKEELSPRDAKRKRGSEDIHASIARMRDVGESIRTQRLEVPGDVTIDSAVLRDLFVNWLAVDSLPFSLCKSRAFRGLLQYVSARANDLLPESDTTIRQDAVDCYTNLKAGVKQRLQGALSSIHVTCDLWTSGNRLSLMGIVAHCVDEDGEMRHLTIALRELEGSHTGENMAKVLWEVLTEYQILTKLGYFTMDNASNNDAMLSFLQRQMQADGITWEASTHRLRCNGHIIHLAVQAFLFGRHPNLSDNDELTNDELCRWRQLGPLGKLHNIVVWIQRSPQRLHTFKKDSGGSAPRRDNATRWNSWFEMLSWSSLPDVRLALEKVSFSERDLYNDRLTANEWLTLDKIKDFLGPFRDATLSTQGRMITLEHVLPSMDFLLQHFEGAKASAIAQQDPLFVACIEAGWVKLNHYYSLTDRSPVYVAAIVLNPRWKFDYFEGTWTQTWIAEAKGKLRSFWEEYYQSRGISREAISVAAAPPAQNAYQAWINSKTNCAHPLDEYSRYLADPVLVHVTDAMQWWVQQRGQYPALATMALDILSIPGMSDEPERVFSGARRTVTDLRGSLKAASIEMLECIKSWRKSSFDAQGCHTDSVH